MAVKSGLNCFGTKEARPSKNIVIRNLTCAGRGGICVGSEMSGGVENVTVSDILANGVVGAAFEIRSSKIRGGFVRDIYVRNVVAKGVCEPLHWVMPCAVVQLHSDYPWGHDSACPQPEAIALPSIHDIVIENVSGGTVKSIDAAVSIVGIKDAPIANVTFRDTSLDASAWICSNFSNITIEGVVTPAPCKATTQQQHWPQAPVTILAIVAILACLVAVVAATYAGVIICRTRAGRSGQSPSTGVPSATSMQFRAPLASNENA